MGIYEVVLGVDRAARDTGRQVGLRVCESDPLSAALRAEELVDQTLEDPATMYTHAVAVRPVLDTRPRPAAAMPLAVAA